MKNDTNNLTKFKYLLLIVLVFANLVNADERGYDADEKATKFSVSPYDQCEGCDPAVSVNLTQSMLGMGQLSSPDGSSEGNHCDDTHCNCTWTGCNNFTQQCAGYGYTSVLCVTELTDDGYPIGYGCECSGPRD